MDVNETLRCARLLINSKNYAGAKSLLDSVPKESRNNEWYCLFGMVSVSENNQSKASNNENLIINATVELFPKKKAKKPKKPMSAAARSKIKRVIKIFLLLTLSVCVVVGGFVLYSEITYELNRRNEAEKKIQTYQDWYNRTPYTFKFIEINKKDLEDAFASAKKNGYHISIWDELEAKRKFIYITKADVDKLNQLLIDLSNGVNRAYYSEINLLTDIIRSIEILKEIQPYNYGIKFDELISQLDSFELTLAWVLEVDNFYHSIK